MVALTRAREATRFQRAVRRAAPSRPTGSSRCSGGWPTSPLLFSGIVVRRFWFGGDDGARAIGATADAAVAGAASASATGSSTNDRKFCSTDRRGACSRSRSAAAAGALNDHQNLAALLIFAALTRAREGRADSSELCDRAAPSRPTGSSRRCGCWSTSPFLFSGLLFAVRGRRWSSGDRR